MKRFIYALNEIVALLLIIFLIVAGFWYAVSYILIDDPEPMEILVEFKDEPVQFSVCGEWKDAVIKTEFY